MPRQPILDWASMRIGQTCIVRCAPADRKLLLSRMRNNCANASKRLQAALFTCELHQLGVRVIRMPDFDRQAYREAQDAWILGARDHTIETEISGVPLSVLRALAKSGAQERRAKRITKRRESARAAHERWLLKQANSRSNNVTGRTN